MVYRRDDRRNLSMGMGSGRSGLAFGSGDARVYMSTVVAHETWFDTTTRGKKKRHKETSQASLTPRIRPDDSHGSRLANIRLNDMRVIPDELPDTLSSDFESHGYFWYTNQNVWLMSLASTTAF